VADGFTDSCGVKRLVFFEHHLNMRSAIQREKNMRQLPRA
jgi:predicted GIY-YIG superfamily endonuclease